jgi:hypothetical protein
MVEKHQDEQAKKTYVPGSGGREAEKHRQRTITMMLKRFGRLDPARTCGECGHLLTRTPGNYSYFKCELFRDSGSSASDWRKVWPACGRFKEGEPDGELDSANQV